MKVQEIMTTKVESIKPDATLRQAARKMSDLGIGSLAVMDGDKLLGIITDRDISCHAVAIGRDPNFTNVEKVMIKGVATCFEDEDIAEAAQLMEDRHVRRLTVLHQDKTVAGMLSVDDLVHGSHDLAGAVLEAATPIH